MRQRQGRGDGVSPGRTGTCWWRCVVDGTYEATITRLDVRQIEEAREKVAEDRTRHRIRVERRSILDTVAGDLLPAAQSPAPVGRGLDRGGGCCRGAHCPWKPCSTWCAFWFIIVPETKRGWLLSSWQASVGSRSASAAQRGDSRCAGVLLTAQDSWVGREPLQQGVVKKGITILAAQHHHCHCYFTIVP